ncbi:alpha/beta hydrolase family protein [Planctomicrobium sp. SH668]|uniref:alpha/beta hydrolase family protein n=1 Tax=Planctomicrobium sp. SH668 TaxID=3448126 RepID=UPI003F5C01B4
MVNHWTLRVQFLSLLTFMAGLAMADSPPTHTDESKVSAYQLPDPLTFADGTPVKTAEDWFERRRPELLKLFAEQMYGKLPPAPEKLKYQILSQDEQALDGKAIRKEVEITLVEKPTPVTMTMLIYIPKNSKPAPVFWGLNFRGNHSVTADPQVRLNPNWMANGIPGVVDHQATEESRNSHESRYPIPMIIDRGYAVATAYYGDIDPDFDDQFQNGIHPAFYSSNQSKPLADEWGAIGAWAWAMSRGVDYLQMDSDIDGNRIAGMGHSRLGKTALWAGANDPRFALTISNESGCGGAAISRREYGETVWRINHAFPHWFCENFKKYNGREAELPFDQHELIALIAPRPVYIASALDDQWADPKGEFLAARFADPVYRFLGTSGMGGDGLPEISPEVDQPLQSGIIGYHIRSGKHDLTEYDWARFLDFADINLQKK